jgi:hypothetical protein
MVPMLAVQAIGVGGLVAVGRLVAWPTQPRLRHMELALALVAGFMAIAELHPWKLDAPMLVEAQWDRPNVADRKRVTDCLRAEYDGDKIMASMGSLGHYMQETSRDGFAIRDFLHEGNGDIWLAALESPRPYAAWIAIEEKAEGGDMLALRAREHPAFLAGYSRVCDGAGLALYKRDERW